MVAQELSWVLLWLQYNLLTLFNKNWGGHYDAVIIVMSVTTKVLCLIYQHHFIICLIVQMFIDSYASKATFIGLFIPWFINNFILSISKKFCVKHKIQKNNHSCFLFQHCCWKDFLELWKPGTKYSYFKAGIRPLTKVRIGYNW